MSADACEVALNDSILQTLQLEKLFYYPQQGDV